MSMLELYKQIDAVVEAKTFSLEATKAIQALKSEHHSAIAHNAELSLAMKEMALEITRLKELLSVEKAKAVKLEKEEEKYLEREKALFYKEINAAEQCGQSQAYRTIFDLMFKNTIVREQFQKGVVSHALETPPGCNYEIEKKKGRTDENTSVERTTL